MAMLRFVKKKTCLPLGLMFFLGVYFLLSPFLHFHPEDVHAHAGELRLHHHDGHYHSHELEALAHAWDLHPVDTKRDSQHHHSHSSPEHDSDKTEFSSGKTSLKKTGPLKLHKELVSYPFSAGLSAFRAGEIPDLEVFAASGPSPFQGRSPPVLFT